MCSTFEARAITHEHVARWRAHFSEEELLELGALMASADGFGKLLAMLGVGQPDQSCAYEA